MRRRTGMVVATGLLLSVALLYELGFGADTEETRKPLVGLEGLAVSIEGITADAEKDGLTKDALQTAVELKLRLAGIGVLTDDEARKLAGAPFLRVRLSLRKRLGTYQYVSKVEFTEQATLVRDPKVIIDAVTWGGDVDTGEVFYTGFAERLRNAIQLQVDKFMNDYLASNPKK